MQAPAAAFRRLPERVLLDKVARISRCCSSNNATTAAAETSDGRPIEVSFFPADPPALTRCVVQCPGLNPTASGHHPLIVAADGAFVLVRVTYPDPLYRPRDVSDLFIYRSGPGVPSLELVHPPSVNGCNLSRFTCVLSCDGGEHCLVVDPRWETYHLRVFSTQTKSWTTKVARPPGGLALDFCPSEVFSVGGGAMACVDLRYGILVFDSVAGEEQPQTRLIQLPPLMPINYRYNFSVGYSDCLPTLETIRHVICRDGWFRFIEIGYPELHDEQSDFRWEATMFKRLVRSDHECQCQWEPCGTAYSDELSPDIMFCPASLPDVLYSKDNNKLTLNNAVTYFPTMDFCGNDIVYMIATMKAFSPSGWVLSVNITNKKLEKISPFSMEGLSDFPVYRQSEFPKHLSKAPDTHLTKVLDGCTNRRKIQLVENNLLAALEQLQNIEMHMKSLSRRYNWSMPLLFSDSASSLNQKIQADAGNGLNDGSGSLAFSESLRLMGDLKLQIFAPIDVIKSKIQAAHGALYSLMGTLPSDALDKYFVDL
uniref:DUF1618 domain-containing protein n=1 Tax=Leersia perrieri TaxID=77586 RepID=A0A0D9UZF6_9ORYZ